MTSEQFAKLMLDVQNAKRSVSRAFDMLDQYSFGTIGHREAVDRNIPNAIEKLIDAKVAAIGGKDDEAS